MKDGFETAFVVDLDTAAVWEALTAPIDGFSAEDEGGRRQYLLAGFPSMVPMVVSGAAGSEVEIDPATLLKVRKSHEPCAGTEIAVMLESVDDGTRITLVQSGFGPWLADLRDMFEAHWREIVADFRLYLERGIRVPPKNWGAGLGGMTRETPVGLEISSVDEQGMLARAGIVAGNLLLSLRGVRIYNTQQLWTVLALCAAGDDAPVSWARGSATREVTSTF